MTLVAVFTRAALDDTTHEVEVADIVFDFDSVEDGERDRTIAQVAELFGGQRMFLPVDSKGQMFTTLTVVPKQRNVSELIEALDSYDALDDAQRRLIESWAAGADVNDVAKFDAR